MASGWELGRPNPPRGRRYLPYLLLVAGAGTSAVVVLIVVVGRSGMRVDMGSLPAWLGAGVAGVSAAFAAWTIRNDVRKRSDDEEKLWWSRAHSIIGSVASRDAVGAHARELEFQAQSYSDLPVFGLRVAVSVDPVGTLTCHLLRSDRPVRVEQEAGSVVIFIGHLAPGGTTSATVRCESKVDWRVGPELWSFSDARQTVWHGRGADQWRRGAHG